MAACPRCEAPTADAARFCASCGAPMSAPSRSDDVDALVGRVIARNFRIEAVLGTGGMGRVYRARQISLDKPVVLKVLHPQFNNDRALAERFHREARAASRLNHQHS